MGKPLTNIEISDIFTKDKITQKIYKGQFFARENSSIKSIIQKIKTPALVLFNTDTAEGAGLHWIIVYYTKKITVWFDPLGFTPIMYAFPYVVSRAQVPVEMNTHNVQLLKDSVYCGHFCVVYGLLLARGKSLLTINNFFTNNIIINEYIAETITKWLKKIL